ncbi:MAG TPA: glycosyl hydrolase [Sphingobium sp.]|uniref:glycosyl hydrolase n=1 Tax=Sphingobium sp. TaxID=1912891 RepID=UPI002ED51427
MKTHRIVSFLAALCTCSAMGPALHAQTSADRAASMEELFRDPPASARPRTWWHWLNGNISEEGLIKDLDWMKGVGLGGVQAFDAFVPSPQIVDRRLNYMSPEWQAAFRATAEHADKLDLELGIATSPGWSATGGPWVKPEDAMKKLVWSETAVKGGRRFSGALPRPPMIAGPYLSLAKAADIADMMWGKDAPKWPASPEFYADVAVMAIPVGGGLAVPAKALLQDGSALSVSALQTGDLNKGIDVPRGIAQSPTAITLVYDKAQTIRSATLYVANARMIPMSAALLPALEASDDGKAWRHVAELPAGEVPTTISFAPVTARYFRAVLKSVPPVGIDLGAPAPGAAMPGDAAEFMKSMSAPWQVRQFTLSSEARVDQFQAKAGFSVVDDYHALPVRSDGAIGADPRKIINLTDKMGADGQLDWTPPPGEWRIVRLGWSLVGKTNHPANPEATGLEVDKYDAGAVRRYLDSYLAKYRDAVGPQLIGKHGIRALVSDSLEVGPANWTPNMVAEFKRLRGYDPTPWLPTLAGFLIGDRTSSDKFLFDYRRTIADLLASRYYTTLAETAHANDLRIYGEALESHRFSLGDDIAMRSPVDVPMGAMWTFARGQKPNSALISDIKGAASTAHIYGQNVVAAESMTSGMNYWNDSPASLKRIIDLEFANGVNIPVIHTSAHSPSDTKLPGISLFYFGQFFNRHESWGTLARPWVDYLARNSFMLQQGVNVADVAYFYGEEAPIISLFGTQLAPDAPRTHAFDFVNADALLSNLTNDGDAIVSTGGARYKALYLAGSTTHMSLAVLQRLAQLVEAGATVVGMAPSSDPGLAGNAGDYAALTKKLWPGTPIAQVGKGQVIASRDIESALAAIGVTSQFRYSGAVDADIPFVERKLADGESFFLVNRKNRPEIIEAHFRVAGKKPELWHAETGKSEAVSYTIRDGETVIPLSLAAEQSVHIVFRKPATSNSVTVRVPTLVTAAELTNGAWTVRFEKDRGAPESISLAKLSPLNEAEAPGVRYFSGVATYSRNFDMPRTWKEGTPLWLDLGTVGDLAEIRINGMAMGSAWHAPYRIDVGAGAHRGKNTLEVRVANLWVNRLIGDAQQGANKVTFTSLPTYRPDAPLRPSGLIGPVQLLVEHGQ